MTGVFLTQPATVEADCSSLLIMFLAFKLSEGRGILTLYDYRFFICSKSSDCDYLLYYWWKSLL